MVDVQLVIHNLEVLDSNVLNFLVKLPHHKMKFILLVRFLQLWSNQLEYCECSLHQCYFSFNKECCDDMIGQLTTH